MCGAEAGDRGREAARGARWPRGGRGCPEAESRGLSATGLRGPGWEVARSAAETQVGPTKDLRLYPKVKEEFFKKCEQRNDTSFKIKPKLPHYSRVHPPYCGQTHPSNCTSQWWAHTRPIGPTHTYLQEPPTPTSLSNVPFPTWLPVPYDASLPPPSIPPRAPHPGCRASIPTLSAPSSKRGVHCACPTTPQAREGDQEGHLCVLGAHARREPKQCSPYP